MWDIDTLTAGLSAFEDALWVGGNILGLLIFFSAAIFSVLYRIWFDPRTTTAGYLIGQAILAVAGFGLLTVLGVFVNGATDWWDRPGYVEWWRPGIRLIIYALIAYTFARLVVLLYLRKFRPERLKTRPDETTLVRVRHPKS